MSEGIGLGTVCIYRTEIDDISVYSLQSENLAQEIDRYYSSVNEVSQQFMAKQNRIAREIGSKHAEIYEAYRMIIEDPFFQEEVPQAIRGDMVNAESVIKNKLRILEKRFESIEDEYLRERIYDIRGVSRRIIYHLMQHDNFCEFDSEMDNILIARELTPVDAIHFQHRTLKGIITEYGGKTSHAAILAHSLEIAAVVGVRNLMKHINGVHEVAIDAEQGKVILNPDKETKKEFAQRIEKWDQKRDRLRQLVALPLPKVQDEPIRLLANINDNSEIDIARNYRADGVGLFRTELPFIAHERLLSEEEQYQIYRKLLEGFPGQEVTIRLLDVGGDKFIPFESTHHELNPFLGWRSIRILLSDTDVFRNQLRALYRASVHGSLKIMIPMISSREEIVRIKNFMDEIRADMDFAVPEIPLGIMVEVPSAAISIERLLPEVDFASIGTNDLVQYTLAVDRNNEKVAGYYQPLNFAVLALIKQVVAAGRKQNKDISICGEIAGDPLYVPLLLALGVRKFSMHPAALPKIKNILLKMPESVYIHLARNYDRFETSEELMAYLKSQLQKLDNHVFDSAIK